MGALGKAPDQAGNGLTPLEHRRIIWTQYQSFGLLGPGGEVEGTATMAYRVLPGATVVETSAANREAVIVPIPDATVPTIPAPSTGSRKDYVQLDTDGQVYVTQAPVDGRFTLDERIVSAGITATTATTGAKDRAYAVPVAGMLGVMDRWDETLGHRVAIPTGRVVLKAGRFVVPGDRRMKIAIRHSATAAGYVDPIGVAPDSKPLGAYLYTLTIDQTSYKLVFYHAKTWGSQNDEVDFWVTAGAHTWTLTRELWMGAGGITLGNGSSQIPPSSVKIVDQGATR